MKKLFVTLVTVLGLVSSIEARIIPPNLDYDGLPAYLRADNEDVRIDIEEFDKMSADKKIKEVKKIMASQIVSLAEMMEAVEKLQPNLDLVNNASQFIGYAYGINLNLRDRDMAEEALSVLDVPRLADVYYSVLARFKAVFEVQ
jgi:hypothetical protein